LPHQDLDRQLAQPCKCFLRVAVLLLPQGCSVVRHCRAVSRLLRPSWHGAAMGPVTHSRALLGRVETCLGWPLGPADVRVDPAHCSVLLEGGNLMGSGLQGCAWVPERPEYGCTTSWPGMVIQTWNAMPGAGQHTVVAALQQRGAPPRPACACAQRCRVVLVGLGRAMWFDSVHTAPADQQRYLEQVEAVLLLQATTHSSTAAAAAACCWGVWHNMHAVSVLEHVDGTTA